MGPAGGVQQKNQHKKSHGTSFKCYFFLTSLVLWGGGRKIYSFSFMSLQSTLHTLQNKVDFQISLPKMMFEISKPYQTTKQSRKKQEKQKIKRMMADEEKPFSEQLRYLFFKTQQAIMVEQIQAIFSLFPPQSITAGPHTKLKKVMPMFAPHMKLGT